MSRPRVTVHFAQSLDGRLATRTGDSQWFGGKEALTLAHTLRSEHDAVLVGIGTVLADNPRLTTRLVDGPSPLRVVLDTRLRIPRTCNLLTERAEMTFIAAGEDVGSDTVDVIVRLGARVLRISPGDSGALDLTDLLTRLRSRGIQSLLVEGGGATITSFLQRSLVDRLVICISPKIVGCGIDAVGDLGVTELSNALTFSQSSFAPLGPDVTFDGTLGGRR